MSRPAWIWPLALVVAATPLVDLAASPQTSSAPEPTPDRVLSLRLERVLSAASDVPARDLDVEVADGRVAVSGVVRSSFVQQSIGAVIRAVPGVVEVSFAIRVDPADPP